jgi:hypothetical protein
MIISFTKLKLYFASNSQKLILHFTACYTGLFTRNYYSETSKYFLASLYSYIKCDVI